MAICHDQAKIPKWILKDDSITESVASLWSSVLALDKLTKVFVALFQLKQLLLGKANDKNFFSSLDWQMQEEGWAQFNACKKEISTQFILQTT